MEKQDVEKLLTELVRAPEELFLEDRAVELVRRAARAIKQLAEVQDGAGAVLNPLEWRSLGHGNHVAEAPLFGRIRVESYGDCFHVEYSVPGYSNTFVEGRFATDGMAKEAAENEYRRRMQLAMVGSVADAGQGGR